MINSEKTFHSEFQRIVASDPDFRWLTILGKNGPISYTRNQLAERVHDFLDFYRKNGIYRDDVVLIILKESLDLFAGFIAGIFHGALPAYSFYPSPKQNVSEFLKSLRHLTAHGNVKMLICFGEVYDIILQNKGLPEFSEIRTVQSQDIPSLKHPSLADDLPPFSEGFLQFSSGTTGAKRGVRISSHALFSQITAYETWLGYDAQSRVISWLPHYHDMGLIACMLMPLLKGVPLFMMSPFEWVQNPRMFLEAITQYQCTHLWLPNFALGHLTKSVNTQDGDAYDLRSIKKLVCCSEPVLYETVVRFLDKFCPLGLDPVALQNCYAMAENTFAITSTEQGPIPFAEIAPESLHIGKKVEHRPGGKRIASAGKPLANVRLKIVNEEGAFQAEDVVGEIVIHSDCMLSEYYRNPEETQSAFLNGYFRTGDLGFLQKGSLFVTGRKKELIILAGENFYPQDFEMILNDQTGFLPGRNVVFGVEDEDLGTERLVILAEVREGFEKSDTGFLRQKILDTFNIAVSDFLLLPPRTLRKGTAGKVSRHLNKLEYLKGTFSAKGSKLDANSIDDALLRKVVLEVVPDYLKDTVTEHTPLFRSGILDSLGFMRLLSSIEHHFSIRVEESFCSYDHFQTLSHIKETLRRVREVIVK